MWKGAATFFHIAISSKRTRIVGIGGGENSFL